MKINISKLAFLIIPLLCIVVLFYSCKKEDIKLAHLTDKPIPSALADAATIERTKQAIISSGQAINVTMPVNQKASDIYFSDAQNNRIDILALAHNAEASRISVCDYQYDPNGDPIEDMFPANFNLNSTGYIYDCGSGSSNYRVSFEWGLAVHHAILSQNLYGTGGSALRSRFTLKIKNSAGTVIATYTNNYLLSDNIIDLGDWATDPTRTLYKVNATIDVPTIIFSSGVTYETTLTLATDCNLTPQLSGLHTTTSLSSLNTQPCKRTDKVWINGAGPGGCLTAAGTFLVCTPPSGYVVTPDHELQYRLKNTSVDSWDAQTSGSVIYPSSTSYYSFSTYIGVINLNYATPGTGTWLIRYRNKNSCSPVAPFVVEIRTL